MTDHPDINEQLAAFLAGELDEDAADAIQQRIDSEPWVARLADAMADMLVDLGGVDDVTPPKGFDERLRTGVAAELGRPVQAVSGEPRRLRSTTAAATGWAGTDRSRPVRRRGPSTRALAIAAGIALAAVATVGVLVNSGFGTASDDSVDTALGAADDRELAEGDTATRQRSSDDSAATEAAADGEGEPSGDEGAVAEDADAGDAALSSDATEEALMESSSGPLSNADSEPEESGEATAAGAPAPNGAPAPEEPADDSGSDQATATVRAIRGPELRFLGAIEDDGVLVAEVADRPSATELIGVPLSETPALSEDFRRRIEEREAYPDGRAASTCLDEALAGAGEEVVPAVAARVDVDGVVSVAFALVRSADGEVLDTVDVWLLGAGDCQVRRVIAG